MPDLYQLSDIRFSYGDTPALSLPSLTVKSGKITALIGPNGCGKSTLLNLLAFLEPPQNGKIRFQGRTITSKLYPELRRCIGVLPQKPYMLRGTVADNLKLALKLHGFHKALWHPNINRALERLNIAHLKTQKATNLSGGELQKAALARALVTDPQVLLLDEPFSYLDQSSMQLLEDFISSYTQETGCTLIFSTHNRFQGLALADEVVSLVNGKPIKTPLINLFTGQVDNHTFNTGKISVTLTGDITHCRHISIDPHEIVLSRLPLVSSIRNQFQGRITTITEEMGKVRIAVSAGEVFQALITFESLKVLDLNLGDYVWVSFKSNSIVAF
ncbi:MAG: ABC transporter ATP-binding protein [Gammaproteobacteria bacterium]